MLKKQTVRYLVEVRKSGFSELLESVIVNTEKALPPILEQIVEEMDGCPVAASCCAEQGYACCVGGTCEQCGRTHIK